MTIPNGAPHKRSCSGQYAKRSGDEFEGGMTPLLEPGASRQAEIHQMLCLLTRGSTFTDICATLYDAGYRKFEIVEEDV